MSAARMAVTGARAARTAAVADGAGRTPGQPEPRQPSLHAAGHRFAPVWLRPAAPVVQCNAEVTTPGDPFEREADRVADAMTGGGRPPVPAAPRDTGPWGTGPWGTGPGGTGRGTGRPGPRPEVAGERVRAARGDGRPLDAAARGFFEPRLGHDLGGVRVHAGDRAGRAARDLNARAFTHGNDVFFATGAYQPASRAGRWLLAHELAHTVQQRPGVIARQVATAEAGSPAAPGADAAVHELAVALRSDPDDRSGQVRRRLERLEPAERQRVVAGVRDALGPGQLDALAAVLVRTGQTAEPPAEPPPARPATGPRTRPPETSADLAEPPAAEPVEDAAAVQAAGAGAAPPSPVEPPADAAAPTPPARGDGATVERTAEAAQRTGEQRLAGNAGKLAEAAAEGEVTGEAVEAGAAAEAAGAAEQTAAEDAAGITAPEGGFPHLVDLLAAPEPPPASVPGRETAPGTALEGPSLDEAAAEDLAGTDLAGTDLAGTEALPAGLAAAPAGPVGETGEAAVGSLAVTGAVATLEAAPGPAEGAIQEALTSATGTLRRRGRQVVARVQSRVATAGGEMTAAVTTRRDTAERGFAAAEAELDRLLEARRQALRDRAAGGKLAFTVDFAKHWYDLFGAVSDQVGRAGDLRSGYAAAARRRSREQADRARAAERQALDAYPRTTRGAVQWSAASGVAARTAREIDERTGEVVVGVEEVFQSIPDELRKHGQELLAHVADPLPKLSQGVDEELARSERRLDQEATTARWRLRALRAGTLGRLATLEQGLNRRLATFVPKAQAEVDAAVSTGVRVLRRARRTGVKRVRQLAAEGVEILRTAENPDEESSNRFAAEVAEVIRGAGEETVQALQGDAEDMAAELDRVPAAASASLRQIRAQVEPQLAEIGTEAAGAADIPTQADANFGLIHQDLDSGLTAARTLVQAKLGDALTTIRADLRKTTDAAERKAAQAVDDGFAKNEEALARLPGKMREAAGDAAWDYDHPILSALRDVGSIIAGVVVGILAIIALVVIVIIAVKVAIAALILIGFTALAAKIIVIGALIVVAAYGAYKTYQSYRAQGQSAGGALLSTALALTGIGDIARAFSDENLTPYERGKAFGGGAATLASLVFLRGSRAKGLDRAISARLPKVITNPSRFGAWRAFGRVLGVGRPAAAPTGIGAGTVSEAFAAARPAAPPVARPPAAPVPAGPAAPVTVEPPVTAARPVTAPRPVTVEPPPRVVEPPAPPRPVPAAAAEVPAGRPKLRVVEGGRQGPPASAPRAQLGVVEEGGIVPARPQVGPKPRPPAPEAAALERPVEVRQAMGAEGARPVPVETPAARPRLQVVGGQAPEGPVAAAGGGGRTGGGPRVGKTTPSSAGTAGGATGGGGRGGRPPRGPGAKPARGSKSRGKASGKKKREKKPRSERGIAPRDPHSEATLLAEQLPRRTSSSAEEALRGEGGIVAQTEETARTAGTRQPTRVKYEALAGTHIEGSFVQAWAQRLRGYNVIPRGEFGTRSGYKWLNDVFPRNARPDLVAVHPKQRIILVGDVAPGPRAAHLKKTADYARKLLTDPNVPAELNGYRVVYQEHWYGHLGRAFSKRATAGRIKK